MRDTSTAARAALYAPQTAAVFLHLLTIDHDDMPSPVRFVDNLTDIVSNGDTYTAFPFRAVLPADVDNELPQLDLIVDNVTRELVDEVRSIATPATVSIDVVIADDPYTIEAGPFLMEVVTAVYTATEMKLTLTGERLLNEPYPVGLFTPLLFPLLFNAVGR